MSKFKKRLLKAINKRRRVAAYIQRYKKNGECKQCGSKDNLTFHHRDSTKKYFNLGSSDALKHPLPVVKAEIHKCDLLCRECHDIVHGIKGEVE